MAVRTRQSPVIDAPAPPPERAATGDDDQRGDRKAKRGRAGGGGGAGKQGRRDGREQIDVLIHDTLVHTVPASVARSLRYLLAADDLPYRLAVTSAIHGEGVTTISRAVATLIAHDWRRSACWVDLNWWARPSNRSLDLFDATIVDVIDGSRAISELATPTSVPGLSFVAAGEAPIASRAHLPKSEGLEAVIAELARSFDFLVFDVPPVLASSDALALTGYADSYLLVVRQRSTSSAQVRAALNSVTSAPCMGTVLNHARSNVPRWLRTSNEIWPLGT